MKTCSRRRREVRSTMDGRASCGLDLCIPLSERRNAVSHERILTVVIAIVLVGAVVAPVRSQPAPSPASSEDLGHVRVERTFFFRKAWNSYLSGDAITIANLYREAIATPVSVDAVDVTVTATLDVSARRGDAASIWATLTGEESASVDVIDPGFMRFAPPRKRGLSSTSITWAAVDLPAAGRTYDFAVQAQADDGPDSDRGASVRGKRLTVIIEMWPAGR